MLNDKFVDKKICSQVLNTVHYKFSSIKLNYLKGEKSSNKDHVSQNWQQWKTFLTSDSQNPKPEKSVAAWLACYSS